LGDTFGGVLSSALIAEGKGTLGVVLSSCFVTEGCEGVSGVVLSSCLTSIEGVGVLGVVFSPRSVTIKDAGVFGVVVSSRSVATGVAGVLGVVDISEGEGLVDVGVDTLENTDIGLLGVEGPVIGPSKGLVEGDFPLSVSFSSLPSLFNISENDFFCPPERPKNPELGPLNALNPLATAGFVGVVVGVVDSKADFAAPIWEVEPNTGRLWVPS
jgi:hypothetical protein